MDLSTNIVKQFAEIVGNSETPSNGTTVYGTIVESNGTRCVKIDGSDEVTPVSTAVSIAPGERVLVLLKNHTATVTGNVTDPSASAKRLEDAEGNISEIERTADQIKQTVQNFEGDITEIKQTAKQITSTVESHDGAITEIKQTANDLDFVVRGHSTDIANMKISSESIQTTVEKHGEAISKIEQSSSAIITKVEDLEEGFSQFSQTAGAINVHIEKPGVGTLSTTIDSSTWEAIYKTITGETGSGFYFDFAKGQFVFDGTGRFRNGDATTYVEIENDELVFYSGDADKIRLGFMSQPDPNNLEANVDYPYMLLGKAGDDDLGEKVGMVKKFYNGLWIGNSVPKNAFGNFAGMEKANGFFIDTVTGVSYVVNGTDMKDVYAGTKEDPTLTSEDITHQGYRMSDCMPVLVTQAQYDEMVANQSWKSATPYLIRRGDD